MGDNYILKNYGPFTVKKPVNLSKYDVYKFGMYVLLKNNFTILSQGVISGISFDLIFNYLYRVIHLVMKRKN